MISKSKMLMDRCETYIYMEHNAAFFYCCFRIWQRYWQHVYELQYILQYILQYVQELQYILILLPIAMSWSNIPYTGANQQYQNCSKMTMNPRSVWDLHIYIYMEHNAAFFHRRFRIRATTLEKSRYSLWNKVRFPILAGALSKWQKITSIHVQLSTVPGMVPSAEGHRIPYITDTKPRIC